MLLGGRVGYWALRCVKPPARMVAKHWNPPPNSTTWPMLNILFGSTLWEAVKDKVVIDVGCGTGADVIELAKKGARLVIGIDKDPRVLDPARRRADAEGVGERCVFATETSVTADIIVSCDTFEHVYCLHEVLREMRQMLAPNGSVWASFGPPWYHPRGGHTFSVFPWAHLVFTENALTRWRSAFKPGSPVSRFLDCGLNRMTVRRFLETLELSPFMLEYLELVPIRRLRRLGLQRFRLTREFVTAAVKCRLIPRREGLTMK